MRIDNLDAFISSRLFKFFDALKSRNIIKLFYAFQFTQIFNESNKFKIEASEFESFEAVFSSFDDNEFIKIFHTRTHYLDALLFYIYF